MTRASNLKDIHLMSTVAFCNSRFEEMLSNEMQPDNFAYNALRAQHVSVMFLLFFLTFHPYLEVSSNEGTPKSSM